LIKQKSGSFLQHFKYTPYKQHALCRRLCQNGHR
jgi:hypothetical protein